MPRQTGEFVANMATYDLREVVNLSSTECRPGDQRAGDALGLEMAPCRAVKPPRVARSPVALECKYFKTVDSGRRRWHATAHRRW